MFSATAKSEFDIYYPVGSLCLTVHRNGELTLSENTVYPIRKPGYELLVQKPAAVVSDGAKVPESAIRGFLADKCRALRFPGTAAFEWSVNAAREMLERFDRRAAGERLLIELDREDRKRWSAEKNRDKNLHDSLQRSKKNLIHYAFNNEWSHFVTFTVNSEKCDRYSLMECNKKIGTVLNEYRRYLCPSFKYLLIPEKHEDGAFHYHGFALLPRETVFTLAKVKSKVKHTIDHFTDNLGFNDFSEIKYPVRAAKYITKYIEKQIDDKQNEQSSMRNIRAQIKDAKLLLHSRGLRKGIRLFFRTEDIPKLIHPPVDEDTGEVFFSYRLWGACRTGADLEKFCRTVVNGYGAEGHEIFGYILGLLSRLRTKKFFDIKV